MPQAKTPTAICQWVYFQLNTIVCVWLYTAWLRGNHYFDCYKWHLSGDCWEQGRKEVCSGVIKVCETVFHLPTWPLRLEVRWGGINNTDSWRRWETWQQPHLNTEASSFNTFILHSIGLKKAFLLNSSSQLDGIVCASNPWSLRQFSIIWSYFKRCLCSCVVSQHLHRDGRHHSSYTLQFSNV